jgi:ABC-type antimicrobial peptide transport system permease subunit
VQAEPEPTVYVSSLQMPSGFASFSVRVAGNPAGLASSIRDVVHQIDKDLPVENFVTQDQLIDQTLWQELLFAKLLSFFGGLALLLACIGLYGTLSYAVARRTTEIGIRMALGAQRGNIVLMVLRGAMLMVVLGIGIGLPATLFATRAISALLYGLGPTDLITIVMASVALVAASGVAAYLPARRASNLDPMTAVRSG